jgi:hypothetical protein
MEAANCRPMFLKQRVIVGPLLSDRAKGIGQLKKKTTKAPTIKALSDSRGLSI